jgi:hypothetical protein
MFPDGPEPGMGMIPDPRQIGDGGEDGPPIPGKSGMGMGMPVGIGGSVPWSRDCQWE